MINYLRDNLKKADLSQCQRLFHGRGHFYPELDFVNVDWFAPVVLIVLYRECEESLLVNWVEELSELVAGCKSVQVQRRYLKNAPTEIAWGEAIETTQVIENGEHYHVHLGRSQNVGIFLDMANGRAWLKQEAQNKRVLNLFSYTCAFSVAAVAGGAEKVVNVDMAKGALSKGRENHQLNKHDKDKVIYQGVDIFKSYSRLTKFGPYDILVCDPPSFQKGSVKIERDYKKIIQRIPKLLKPGGQALLCLNAPDLDEAFLKDQVEEHCPDCKFVERIKNPEVFKEAQNKGLKVLRFSYLPN